MATYRAFQVTGQRQFELVDRELVAPDPGHVRVKVQSCGVCHSDVLGVEGMRAHPSQPIVPGHEIVGVIDAVGDGVSTWQVGDRVGLGFLGGHDGTCDWCRRGDFVNCENQPQPGTTVDGGYAEVVYARATGLVRIPDQLKSLEASRFCVPASRRSTRCGVSTSDPMHWSACKESAAWDTSECNTPTSWATA